MMKMKLLATALLLAMQGSYAQHGPKTESQKKQERFFMCIRSIEKANKDGDDFLTRPEYQPFIKHLSVQMFDDSILEKDELPRDVGHLYKFLIVASGAESGAKAIDIYGASSMEIPFISQDRYDQLQKVCEAVMKELARLGPQTEAPIQLAGDLLSEEEFEEEEEKDEVPASSKPKEEDMDTEMISVHSSFLLYNRRSITKEDLSIGPDSILYAAYVDFVNDLMDTVCPLGRPLGHCPEEPEGDLLEAPEEPEEPETPAGNSTEGRYLLSRRLCGDIRMRRMLCGMDRRRRLGGIFEGAELYEVKATDCPEEYNIHGHEHGILPHCHTIYAYYEILVQKPKSVLFKDVEANYAAVTKSGISDHMLADSLKKIDPKSPFKVLGPGKFRYPYENTHHMEHEAETKPPKKPQHDSYLRL
ncbi:expressed unknown protein [Seminavis robusta]|uniref:Secreted protein n=1 Tax=Seminavis robusta TaxID=568900 RepID=A0A9N8H819_9STRA|nr:expressed unknown protein [Seminavis robusta]|eukprot:Sro201_g085160.1 n/a (416) ;mRNA; r:68314-69839